MLHNEFKVSIEQVTIGDRHRKDLGDLESLAESIKTLGLLQPIGVTEDNRLVFGERRMLACRDILKWRDIHARIIEIDRIVDGEYAENEIRKEFTVSERVAIAEAVATAMPERRGRDNQANCPELKRQQTRDIAAERAGFSSGKTFERAKSVVEHGAPELVDAVDKGEASVSAGADIASLPVEEQKEIVAKGEDEILQRAKEIRAKKALENAERRAVLKAESALMVLPANKFRCIVIDPPWEMEKIDRDLRPAQVGFEYPTMNEEELLKFPLPNIAADDCHLYLWTTHRHLPLAMRLAEAWGFRYQCLMTWVKNVGMTPFSWMYSTEHVLFCRRGSLPLSKLGMRLDFSAKVREHSRKPDEFYDLVKLASPGPRIDIFSREKRDGFDQFGNEASKFAKEAA